MTREALEKAVLYMNLAARSGVPVKSASRLIEQMLKNGADTESIEQATKAYAYGVGKKADFKGLGRFVTDKLKEGKKGDDLIIAIYDEIDRRAHGRRGE